jgi:hypothetical protein
MNQCEDHVDEQILQWRQVAPHRTEFSSIPDPSATVDDSLIYRNTASDFSNGLQFDSEGKQASPPLLPIHGLNDMDAEIDRMYPSHSSHTYSHENSGVDTPTNDSMEGLAVAWDRSTSLVNAGSVPIAHPVTNAGRGLAYDLEKVKTNCFLHNRKNVRVVS